MKNKYLKVLKSKLKTLSVNSVDALYPEDFFELIGCEGLLAREFVELLHKERLLKYKYSIRCSCGEELLLSEARILNINERILCNICGNDFDREEILNKAQIVYSIDRKGVLGFEIDDDGSSEWKQNGYKSIIPFDIIKVSEDCCKMNKKIFIGSSKEAINDMTIVAATLDELNAESIMWNSNKTPIFSPSDYTLDSLIKIAEQVDGAIFMFNADDKIWYTDHIRKTSGINDNVLLEYGLFCGKKGRKKVAFVCKDNPKLATDLLGITYIRWEGSEAKLKIQLENWLEYV